MENEKTQFTPEDVGRTFETSKEGVTAKLDKWDYDPLTEFPCLFVESDLHQYWCSKEGYGFLICLQVFPSRPVEEAPSQPTIDTEVEELARELFVLLIQNKNLHTERVLNDSFDYAEQFIKFRNERRASHGK